MDFLISMTRRNCQIRVNIVKAIILVLCPFSNKKCGAIIMTISSALGWLYQFWLRSIFSETRKVTHYKLGINWISMIIYVSQNFLETYCFCPGRLSVRQNKHFDTYVAREKKKLYTPKRSLAYIVMHLVFRLSVQTYKYLSGYGNNR
jgi:hypothetical protein